MEVSVSCQNNEPPRLRSPSDFDDDSKDNFYDRTRNNNDSENKFDDGKDNDNDSKDNFDCDWGDTQHEIEPFADNFGIQVLNTLQMFR